MNFLHDFRQNGAFERKYSREAHPPIQSCILNWRNNKQGRKDVYQLKNANKTAKINRHLQVILAKVD